MPIAREIYLRLVLDRSTQRVMIVASGEGGMEIEDISMEKPESIVRSTGTGGRIAGFAREIAFALGIEDSMAEMVRTLKMLSRVS